jgi:lysophospholipase L1-like esterase
MQGLITASGITPDTAIFSLGPNDASQGTAASTILTGIQNVLGYWTSAQHALIHFYKPTAATSDSIWDTFSGSLYPQCDTSAIPMFDIDDYVGRRTGGVNDGLINTTDNTHPTVAATRMFGRQLASLISGQISRFETVHLIESPLTSGTYPARPDVGLCPAGYAHYVGHDTPSDWLPGDTWDQTP